MVVIDSLADIFDKIPVRETENAWTVNEKDKGADFKHLTIHNKDNKFFVIENCYYKNWKLLTESKSSFLKDSDCDGVAFTSLDGTPLFLLSELKTGLASERVSDAVSQLVFTYLKLYMPFAVCKDFNPDNYTLIGIIACKPPRDEKQKTFLQDKLMLMMENPSCVQSDIRCLVKLYYEKKIKVKLGKVSFLEGKLLNDNIKDKQITIYLKTADEFESDHASFDLQTELV